MSVVKIKSTDLDVPEHAGEGGELDLAVDQPLVAHRRLRALDLALDHRGASSRRGRRSTGRGRPSSGSFSSTTTSDVSSVSSRSRGGGLAPLCAGARAGAAGGLARVDLVALGEREVLGARRGALGEQDLRSERDMNRKFKFLVNMLLLLHLFATARMMYGLVLQE